VREQLQWYAAADPNLPAVGTIPVPFGAAPGIHGHSMFLDSDILYIGGFEGYITVDVSDPTSPVVIGQPETTQLAMHTLKLNGSGLLAAVTSFSGPSTLEFSLYDASNRSEVEHFVTTFTTPGNSEDLELQAGVAFIADALAGLTVINYLGFDAQGVPPAIGLDLTYLDIDPGLEGIQVVEGSRVTVNAQVTDDIQIRQIDLLLDGVTYILPSFLYFESLATEEVSRVVPMMKLTPVFTVALAVFLLDEVLLLPQYFGIALILAGVLLVSVGSFDDGTGLPSLSRSFWLMLVASVMFAVSSVLTKFLLRSASTYDVYFWSRIGSLLPALAMLSYRPVRRAVSDVVTSPIERRFHLMVGSEVTNLIGLLVFTAALALGPVSIVSAVAAIQTLFVLIYVSGLQISGFPFDEPMTRRSLSVKVTSGVLIIFGVFLVR
jgi:uncharacterized membrane protein